MKSLDNLDLNVILCPKSDKVYEAISSHPDIQLFFSKDNIVIVQKNIDIKLIEMLKELGKKPILSSKSLAHNYPHDIILNSLILGDLFLHNLKSTDESILNHLGDEVKKVHVNQGYTKCSTAIVSDTAAITSDKGIYTALKTNLIDVLYVPPGNIILEGLDYGFIGGTCGLLDENNMAFFGSLDKYLYGNEVKTFLKKHKIQYHYLMNTMLTDRGSLFAF